MIEAKITLAIQTAVGAGGVALLRGDEILGAFAGDPERSWSELLVVKIQELYQNAGISPRETNLVAVCRGPGSFTGIRIGIATAKGLLRAIECARCGVTSFELLADASSLDGDFGVGISAGRGFVFFQSFRGEMHRNPAHGEPRLLSYEQFSRDLTETEQCVVIDEELENRLTGAKFMIPDSRRFIVKENLAPVLGRIAFERFAQNKLTSVDALYLRSAVRGTFEERQNT